MTDLPVRVHALHLHPVKSCAAAEVAEALLIETGLELDRAWMVVDAHGRGLTQRELPRLALVRPTLKHSEMILRAPGMLALHVGLDTVEQPARATLWGESLAAYDMGALSARWFSDFLGREVRLVRFDPEQHRSTGAGEAAWHDVHPLHVTTLQALDAFNQQLVQRGAEPAAMARFRPNIVLDMPLPASAEEIDALDAIDEIAWSTDNGPVRLRLLEPCERCSIVDVDPLTGTRGDTVLRALAERAEQRAPGRADEVSFGRYAVVAEGIECVLRPGMSGTARRR